MYLRVVILPRKIVCEKKIERVKGDKTTREKNMINFKLKSDKCQRNISSKPKI